MNLLPDRPTQLNSQPTSATLANGSSLCLACGLCCTGVLHPHAGLAPGETELAQSLGLTVEPLEEPSHFCLPCPLHLNHRCSVYTALRPRVCGDYRCSLLNKLLAGEISLAQGLQIVGRAHDLLAEVSAHLPPGLTFAHFRPEEAPVGPGDDPGRLLAIVKLARYLQKHFDSAGHTASGGPG